MNRWTIEDGRTLEIKTVPIGETTGIVIEITEPGAVLPAAWLPFEGEDAARSHLRRWFDIDA